jgi:ABC-type nitrate/sulfonate/bicarbonate transport system permease component
MNLRRIYLTVVHYFVSFAILLVGWWGAVRVFRIAPYLLPDPLTVLTTLESEWSSFLGAAGSTFSNMLIGGGIGISLGFLTGALAAYSRRIRWIVEPYLTVFQSFPREAFFPLLVVWLGFGHMPKIVNAGLLSFFPMAIVALSSLSDTRDDYIRLLESWNASRLQTYVFCRVPSALPSLLGGLRVSLPLALIGAVLGEFLGGSEGLGYIIVSSGSAFRVDRVFAAIVVLAMGGMTLVALVDTVRFTVLRRYYQR